jgi:hypothetical protein
MENKVSKRVWKKVWVSIAGISALLIATLVVHIYIVTRPKPINQNLLALARIDVKNNITASDSIKITTWLYGKNGVNHVLCNPASRITVFTYFPAKTSADLIVASFKKELPFQAERFIPSASQMQSGCPVSSTSFSYKAYRFFNHLF